MNVHTDTTLFQIGIRLAIEWHNNFGAKEPNHWKGGLNRSNCNRMQLLYIVDGDDAYVFTHLRQIFQHSRCSCRVYVCYMPFEYSFACLLYRWVDVVVFVICFNTFSVNTNGLQHTITNSIQLQYTMCILGYFHSCSRNITGVLFRHFNQKSRKAVLAVLLFAIDLLPKSTLPFSGLFPFSAVVRSIRLT